MTTWLQRPITIETANRGALGKIEKYRRQRPGEIVKVGEAYQFRTAESAKAVLEVTGYVS